MVFAIIGNNYCNVCCFLEYNSIDFSHELNIAQYCGRSDNGDRNISVFVAVTNINAQIKFTAIDSEGIQQKQYTLFTPQSIYRNDAGLYVIGYNHSKKTDEEVDLKSICNVKFVKTRKNISTVNICSSHTAFQEEKTLAKTKTPKNKKRQQKAAIKL